MSTDRENSVYDMAAPSRPADTPRRFQYGISTLLWIMTATAVICALLFPMPGIVAIPVLMFIAMVVMPAVWTTMIVYGRGYQQTFAIGAIFPAGAILFFGFNVMRGLPLPLGSMGGEEIVFRFVLFVFWLSSFLVGAICVSVRKYVETRNAHATASANGTTQTARQNGE